LRGMVPTDDGSCACPPGTQWDGRACAEPPRAQSPTRISPVQPPVMRPVCPVGLPVGTPPNCCPAQHFDARTSRSAAQPDRGTQTLHSKTPPPRGLRW
jgi:hypothetical protein